MSEVFDLDGFKATKKTNTKVGVVGQDFNLRYKLGRFSFSNKMFRDEDFENKSFKIMVNPVTHAVLLVEAENEESNLLKRTSRTGSEKSPVFKSTTIAEALVAGGLIPSIEGEENSYLDLKKGQTSDGKLAYVIVAGVQSKPEKVEEHKLTTGVELPTETPVTASETLDPSNGLGQVADSEDLMHAPLSEADFTKGNEIDKTTAPEPDFSEEF